MTVKIACRQGQNCLGNRECRIPPKIRMRTLLGKSLGILVGKLSGLGIPAVPLSVLNLYLGSYSINKVTFRHETSF